MLRVQAARGARSCPHLPIQDFETYATVACINLIARVFESAAVAHCSKVKNVLEASRTSYLTAPATTQRVCRVQGMQTALLTQKVTAAGTEYQSVVHMCLQRLKQPKVIKGNTVAYANFKQAIVDPEVQLRHRMVDNFVAVILDCLRDFCTDVVLVTRGDQAQKVRTS